MITIKKERISDWIIFLYSWKKKPGKLETNYGREKIVDV